VPVATPEPSSAQTTACAALTRELRAVLAQMPDPVASAFDVEFLPAPLHNRPERIPEAVERLIVDNSHRYARIAVAYADCGTGGLLDAVLQRHHVERLPGAHCYEFFTGSNAFAELHQAELGTFFLTDYLCRHFDALVIGSLGIDRHPELRDMYFGNYVRVVLLSQTDDPGIIAAGHTAAARLGLDFEHRHVGLKPFASAITTLVGAH
jgi:Protein of unknown function (DUF1638)